MLEAGNDWDLPEKDHQRDEEGAGVDIGVEGQLPDVAVNCGHHLRKEEECKVNISTIENTSHGLTFFVKMENKDTKREARTP